jgi:hypothetical protein
VAGEPAQFGAAADEVRSGNCRSDEGAPPVWAGSAAAGIPLLRGSGATSEGSSIETPDYVPLVPRVFYFAKAGLVLLGYGAFALTVWQAWAV